MADLGRVLLIDTTGFVFRAFHALRDTMELKRDDGHPTGAIYVTLQMLIRVLQKHPAERVACVMDAKGPTFRHEIYPDYKANRPPMDPDLARQIEPLKEFIAAMGLKLACIPGVEADDVIATLHARARSAGMEVVISSSDKDLMQLVDEHTTIVDNLRSEERRYDAEGVVAKYGVPPERVVDLLALAGDASDNVKGIDKVGPKTAATWINRYGPLERILANADRIKGVVGNNLRAAIDRVRLNIELVNVRKDVDLDFSLDDLKPAGPEEAKLRAKCDEFQLKFADRLIRALGSYEKRGEPEQEAPSLPAPERLDDADGLAKWLAAREGRTLGLHVRYRKTGEAPIDDEWEDFAVADGGEACCWIALADKDPEASAAALKALSAADCKFVATDAKRLLTALARRGLPAPKRLDDVGLTAFAAHSQQDSSPQALARRLLDLNPPETLQDADPAECSWFASVAVLAQNALKGDMTDKERGVYEQIDLPLVPVLARMERTGVLIDAGQLKELSDNLAARMEQTEKEVFRTVGHSFNLGSPVQIAEVLFDELLIPSVRKTQKGARSTDESVLSELAASKRLPEEKRRVAERILDYRASSKLRSTYALRLPEWIHPETGRVHTHYSQTEASTGRLASAQPNLQNIPIRTEDGRMIRRAFIAPAGCVLVSADYSQVELRIMAHMSGDPALIAAFKSGEDIHKATAAEIFAVGLQDVNPEQRRFAKSINFGLIYGMSEFGLAKQLGIFREEARAHIGRYFDRYPGVRRFMDDARRQSARDKYVSTLFGRRIHTPLARNERERAAAERAAINAPIQGTAADLIKKAMAEVDSWLEREGMSARLLLQVHDELLLEVPQAEVETVKSETARIMSEAAGLAVPLVVDVSHGANWDEAH